MVASRKAGAQPFLDPARIDSTSSSAASNSAWSSIRVSERRRVGLRTRRCAWPGSRRQIWPGAEPNWAVYESPSHRRVADEVTEGADGQLITADGRVGPVVVDTQLTDPGLQVSGQPLPRPGLGVHAEPAHDPLPGIDGHLVEAPGQLLVRHPSNIASNTSPAAGVGRLGRGQPQSSGSAHSVPFMPRFGRGIQSSVATEPRDAHVKTRKRPPTTLHHETTGTYKRAGRTPERSALKNMHQLQYAAPSRRPYESRCVPRRSRPIGEQPTHDRWQDRIRRCRPRRLQPGPVVYFRLPTIHPTPDGDETKLSCVVGANFDEGGGDEIECDSVPEIHLLDAPPTDQLFRTPCEPPGVHEARSGSRAAEIKLRYGHCQWWLGRWHAKCRIPMGGPIRVPAISSRKARFGRKQGSTSSLHGRRDLGQSQTNSIEDQSVTEAASLLIITNRLNGIDDVGQPFVVVTAHRRIASFSASARTAGRKPSAGTTSTGTPRTSRISRSNRPSVIRLDRGDRSTRMSMSLSGVSSPRATLPNTLTFVAPYFSAAASNCRRRCLRRRPSGVSGRPGRASADGSSRTSNRCPVAAIRRSSMPNAGSRRPDSYALTTLWAT